MCPERTPQPAALGTPAQPCASSILISAPLASLVLAGLLCAPDLATHLAYQTSTHASFMVCLHPLPTFRPARPRLLRPRFRPEAPLAKVLLTAHFHVAWCMFVRTQLRRPSGETRGAPALQVGRRGAYFCRDSLGLVVFCGRSRRGMMLFRATSRLSAPCRSRRVQLMSPKIRSRWHFMCT